MNEELKACPYCNGTAIQHESVNGCRYLRCQTHGCGASGGHLYDFQPDWDKGKDEVENRWNSRPIEDELRKEIARLDEVWLSDWKKEQDKRIALEAELTEARKYIAKLLVEVNALEKLIETKNQMIETYQGSCRLDEEDD